MDRETALALAREKTEKDTTYRHLVSVEGVMRALARKLDGDEDLWALTGLFHDLDQDLTGEDPEKHAYIAAEWLREAAVDERVVNGVLAHATSSSARIRWIARSCTPTRSRASSWPRRSSARRRRRA